jgi:hypothetical protein
MDGIRPKPWTQRSAPGLGNTPKAELTSSGDGSADTFRELARQRLEVFTPQPSSTLVELTALKLAEQKYLESAELASPPAPTLASQVSPRGMLSSSAYLTAVRGAQLTCLPGAAPIFTKILADLDPTKIFGPRQEDGANAWHIAGVSLENQVTASRAAGAVGQVLGIPLTGVYHPREQQQLQRALQPLFEQMSPERAQALIKGIHVQTLLGEMLTANSTGMAGLGGGGLIAISRDQLLDADKLRDYVAHEAGHLVGQALAAGTSLRCISEYPESMYGKGERKDFRSDYATRNAREDFAEAHADLSLHWHQYKKFPHLAMSARGLYGQKLAYIAKNFYGWEIPKPSPEMQRLIENVEAGRTPLGYKNEHGQVVGAQEQFQSILSEMLHQTSEDGTLKQNYFAVPGHEKLRRQWVLDAVSGKPGSTLRPLTPQQVLSDLIGLHQMPAEDGRRPQLQQRVTQELNLGGPGFVESTRNFIQQKCPPEVAQRLSAYLNV